MARIVGGRYELAELVGRGDTGEVWPRPRSTACCVPVKPAVAAGRVYTGNTGGKVYAVDAVDGDEVWVFTVDELGGFIPSPAVADGIVYVGSDNGTVYALDATAPTRPRSSTTP